MLKFFFVVGNTPRLWGNHEQNGGAVIDSGFITGKRHWLTDRDGQKQKKSFTKVKVAMA